MGASLGVVSWPFGAGTTLDGAPLLSVPSADAPISEWQSAFPIGKLPPLPPRGEGYWTEPWCGVMLVSLLCLFFVSSTTSVAEEAADCAESPMEATLARLLVPTVWLWAAVSAFCTAYLLFGNAGEIRRSPATCYPIPEEVARRLIRGESMSGLENVRDPSTQDTYCVRCLVWRRKSPDIEGKPHHCNTCARCVEGFDHHCGVFGRCIVDGNMCCFVTNISMLASAVVTIAAALIMSCAQDDMPPGAAMGPIPAQAVQPWQVTTTPGIILQ
eukprot:TRINITY_DN25499_c0_g1_i1.p1 TRINITY_DN25499_c0_g1~~TRINITY_DN25499_c0_g1_i1.p1  ORF type:complete len:271 (+),score=52.41 TRINITY_DN25499_c0_g1_i1:77-889(+)